ncbi:MAG: PadR family transcriptional regulator [Ruminococcaceae bacterium]|nr:PadR family transcriptional regulator [Oscillospiraceae bacterium]
MPREKFKTLTEQMFYVLLALMEECCGMDIMEKVSQLTAGRVKVGSGTLYNLLEQFSGEGIISETKTEGRRRSYILTQKGRELLEKEYTRLVTQAEDYNRVINREAIYGTDTEKDDTQQMGNMGLAPAY